MKAFAFSFLLVLSLFVGYVMLTEEATPLPTPEIRAEHQHQANEIQTETVLPQIKMAKKQPRNSRRTPFEQFLKSSYEKLPSVETARAEAERNPHDTPESVMVAGGVIGTVAEQMKQDSRNVNPGLKFFKSCALNEEIVNSIRAVCLRNLVDFSSRYRNNVRVTFSDYPEDIQRIARRIPRLR